MCHFVTYSVSCVSVRVLCICLSVRKGDCICFYVDWTHKRTAPTWQQTREGDVWLTEDLLFPNHRCLLSSILSGTWKSEEGTLQRQLPLIFDRVSQTLLQVAQCTIFVMWGQVYLGVVYFIANNIIWRNNVTMFFSKKTHSFHYYYFFFNYCSL